MFLSFLLYLEKYWAVLPRFERREKLVSENAYPWTLHKIIWQKLIDPPPLESLTHVRRCTFLTLFLSFVSRIPLSNEVNTFEMSPNCHLIHSLMLFVISLVISANHLSHLRISFSVFQPKMFAANCSLLSSSSDPNDNPCQTFSEK